MSVVSHPLQKQMLTQQYTSYWNLANYPAAVFPTDLSVDPKLDDKPYEATNSDEAWIKETFDANVSVGVGQVVQPAATDMLSPIGSPLTSAHRIHRARGAGTCGAQGSRQGFVGLEVLAVVFRPCACVSNVLAAVKHARNELAVAT